MPIILLERNQALQNKKIEMPDDVQQERNILYAKMEALGSVHQSKGYKELKGDQNLDNNPNYNKTQNSKKTQKPQTNTELTWNDLEQREHKLRHSDKSPNSDYNLFHGPKYKNWVKSEVQRRRNAVRPVLPNNKKIKEPNLPKLDKQPTIPKSLENQGIRVHENKTVYISESQLHTLKRFIKEGLD